MTSATLSGTPIVASASSPATTPDSTARDCTSERSASSMKNGLPSVCERRPRTKPALAVASRRAATSASVSALVEPLERDALEAPLAAHVGDELDQRVVGVDVDVTEDAEQHEPRRVRQAQHVAQQQQRRLVGPMQVVEHERAAGGCAWRGR